MISKMDDCFVLANGVQIPGVGFGTARCPVGEITEECIVSAIRAGYRNIDTAAIYQNERSVGRGICSAMETLGVKREDLFISTKLWHDHRGYKQAIVGFEESLEALGLAYIDLFLIHWPAVAKWHADWRELNASTWKALEELFRQGRVKAIGVSNFLKNHMEALLEDCEIAPMVNQIEYHPGYGQEESARYCQENGIIVEAWSPLGTGEVLKNKTLCGIGKKYGKTSAHVCLRWLVQKDFIPIPKSVHEEWINANTRIFDFSLTSEEMEGIDRLPYCGGMRFQPDMAKS